MKLHQVENQLISQNNVLLDVFLTLEFFAL